MKARRQRVAIAISLSFYTVSVLVLTPQFSAAQKETENADYHATIVEALEEYRAGRWEEACTLFRQAYAIDPNARPLRGLGMASYEARRYVDAIEALQKALDEQRKPLEDKQRREVEEVMIKAYRFVGRFSVEREPNQAEVRVDGRKAVFHRGELLLNSGRRELVVTAHGYINQTRQLIVDGGQRGKLRFALKPVFASPSESADASPATTGIDGRESERDFSSESDEVIPWLPWVVIGGSSALAVGGAILLGVAANDTATVEGAKEGTRWADIEDAYHRAPIESTAGFIMLGVGAAGIATGIVLLTLDETDDGTQTELSFTPHGLLLRGAL